MRSDKLETNIETDHRIWAERLGLYCLKLNPLGRVGIPDRLIIGPNRLMFFIEFKRRNKRPRRIQRYIHDIIRGFGFNVYVCDNLEEAKGVTLQEVEEGNRR